MLSAAVLGTDLATARRAAGEGEGDKRDAGGHAQ
jgi:hypothetical protein